ncbi:MAG: hypothetical protein COU81_02280 [Candidatus Portnoybacteria bacterium CG10_big_fil_rev_8_21_14_0_10_36_7]|uniref:DNA recombination protein RmuC n=1 Tax=Candidatus Portnoybacteria bacterium CG10_big_fil_rev_8_21_14_0_10_36_7 TaxID=1974812 RepID=A0A2M8KDZ4_9BACT|nr:MAG: hypothetical protein COU81_02280 [Candidatus Portnoybacteria bacterium CG10_big_fil_rev_8_21_14_0_10_36_7]
MADILIILILVLLVVLTGLVIFLSYQQIKNSRLGSQDVIVEWLKDMRVGMDQQGKSLNNRLDTAAQVIRDVIKEIGSMQEIGRQMQTLQDFLRSPKLRGNIGEQVLKDMLAQSLPKDNFAFQYKFKDGQIVDAIIKTDKGIIPIDSKFPLENFRRLSQAKDEAEKDSFVKLFLKDVRKHIDDIYKKYILPQEGTVDFALMYIPSEAIYYEIIASKEPIDIYASDKKVVFVSPNSLYYFLKIIMMALEERKISEASVKILETLKGLSQDSRKFSKNLQVLSGHLSRAKNSFDVVESDFGRLSGKIDNVKFLKVEKVKAIGESTSIKINEAEFIEEDEENN